MTVLSSGVKVRVRPNDYLSSDLVKGIIFDDIVDGSDLVKVNFGGTGWNVFWVKKEDLEIIDD